MAWDQHDREEGSMRVTRVVGEELHRLQAEESSGRGSVGELQAVQTFPMRLHGAGRVRSDRALQHPKRPRRSGAHHAARGQTAATTAGGSCQRTRFLLRTVKRAKILPAVKVRVQCQLKRMRSAPLPPRTPAPSGHVSLHSVEAGSTCQALFADERLPGSGMRRSWHQVWSNTCIRFEAIDWTNMHAHTR